MNESQIFQAAVKLQPEKRTQFLIEACRGNTPLLVEVQALLREHDASGFMIRPAAVEGPTAATAPAEEGAGGYIGPYKLLQQIGEGGMGVVFMAEQETPVRRRVALKIIKQGMDSRQVIARFEAERQALAMMDHQNIARVFDAGTTETGRPYFVMELVHGVPIVRFCEENRLPLRQRLALFVSVCQAIQHAHQKGVIHRDIKPSNILVTLYDDKPVPKVIDFGVAKATEQRLTEKTLFTQFGMLVGTLEYMSPEQAEMNALGVDTRSDVYSLGVLLYELLTGTTPLERKRLREIAFADLVRMIKEDEPQRPSVRLSTSGALPKIAAACQIEPSRLSQLVQGELDWIVMRCLEKDRTRRYDTANGLARDIERYLNDEPVDACPPSVSYRFRKLAAKHKGILTAVAALVSLLIVGMVTTSVLATWALRAQKRAVVAQTQAEQALSSEGLARREAEAAKARAEWSSTRLRKATALANEGIEDIYRSNFMSALDRFEKAAELEPDLQAIYTSRRAIYANLGLWDLAANDYAESFRLSNRAHEQVFFEHAVLCLTVNDDAGFQKVLQEMIRQHAGSENNHTRYLVVRTSGLQRGGPEYTREWARRADKLSADDDKPWIRAAVSLAHLRAGDYDRCIELCQSIANSSSPGGIHRCVNFQLALAHQANGNLEQARSALSEGEKAVDEWTHQLLEGQVFIWPIAWHDWLEVLLLRREATIAVLGREPPPDPRLDKIRQRSLAAVNFGDAFTFLESGRNQVRAKQWDQAAASFSEALARFPHELGVTIPACHLYFDMLDEPEVFDRLSRLHPNDARLWWARGMQRVSSRDWQSAQSDIAQAIVANGGQWPRWDSAAKFILAAAQLLNQDLPAYRQNIARLDLRNPGSSDPFVASVVSRIVCLRGADDTDWAVVTRLADSAVEKEPLVAWYLFASGIAHFRAGNDDMAIQRLHKSLEVFPSWRGRGQNYVVLALACGRQGKLAEAKDWLAQANDWLDEMNLTLGKSDFDVSKSNYASDWLAVQVLLPEANAALGAPSAK